MARAPADTSTIISWPIRVGRSGSTGIPSEYQNLQLSGPHGITTVGSRPSVPFELRSADMPERLQVMAGWNETILTESRIVTLDLAKF